MKRDRITISALVLIAMLIMLAMPAVATDNVLYFNPDNISVSGYSNSVDVQVMADISESNPASATSINITFDPGCVDVTNWALDAGWNSGLDSSAWSIPYGFITISTSAGANPPASGSVPLGTLTLHCNDTEGCCGSWLNFALAEYTNASDMATIVAATDDGTFMCGDGITITKKIWDGSDWVDALGPLGSSWMGQDVRFNITVTAGCMPLSNLVVLDVMDSGLEYNDSASTGATSNTTTTATWDLGSLSASTSTSIEFNATIVGYGTSVNTATTTAGVTDLGLVEVSATDEACVTTMPPAGIDVNKTVWNGSAWVDEVTGATIGETYRFRCEMHNSGSPGMDLTSIVALDVLSDSLEYAGDAKILTPSGVWRDINPPDINYTNNNTVGWTIDTFLQDPLTLQPGQMIVIEFNATVVGYGYDCNEQIAEAWCELAGQPVSGNDTACIDTPMPDLTVTDITVNYDLCSYGVDKAFGPTDHPGNLTQENKISADITELNGIDVIFPFDVTFEIDGTPVCTVQLPGIAAGATETVYCDDQFRPMAGVTYNITVTADSLTPSGEIAETNETNNAMAEDTTAMTLGYKGNHYQDGRNLTTNKYHEGTINLVHSVGDSFYLSGYYNPDWTTYGANWTSDNLTMPETDTCIKEARLYVYYNWDKSPSRNITDYFSMDFNGYNIPVDDHYSDVKWSGHYPYGMLAYDVANVFKVDGNTATLTDSYPGGGKVSMDGMLLVVVYNHSSEPDRIILINEGYDMLGASTTGAYYNYGVSSEEATAYANFTGSIQMDKVIGANLITVAPGASDGGDKNRLYFNGGMWKGIWDSYLNDTQLGMNETDVLTYLSATDNYAAFQSHIPAGGTAGDGFRAANAFLIVETTEAWMSAKPDSDECYNVNEQFDVLVNITPLGAPIMGAQFDLHFNENALQAETVTYGDFLVGEGSVFVSNSDIDNANGVVSFAAARQGTPNGMTTPGTFAIVHFTAMTQGAISELDLVNAMASTNSTPVETIDLVPINGEVEVCTNTLPNAVAKSDFRINNIAEKGLSKAYFNGTESTDTAPGTITYWRWWVDDGSSVVGENAVHLFEVPMYWNSSTEDYEPANVTLTVTDDGIPLMDGSDSIDVTVWIAGDATGDGRVNIADAVTFGMQFGATCEIGPDGLRWYNNLEGDKADLNNDKRVNIGDAMLLGTCWGHTAW